MKQTLNNLIDLSVRELQATDYSLQQIESLLQYVYGIDTQLIEDGTYYLVESTNPNADTNSSTGSTVIVGAGGWSKRKTLFGGNNYKQVQSTEDNLLHPLYDAASIRAFFVHPKWARQGIGSLLMRKCEQAATEAGFKSLELGATLTGKPLYLTWNYQIVEPINLTLPDGVSVPLIKMSKTLGD